MWQRRARCFMQRFVWFVLFVLQCCIHVWCLLFLFCNYGLQEDILSTVRLLPSFHWTRILYKILLCFFANHLGLLVFIWPACYALLRIRRTCRSVFNQLLSLAIAFAEPPWNEQTWVPVYRQGPQRVQQRAQQKTPRHKVRWLTKFVSNLCLQIERT